MKTFSERNAAHMSINNTLVPAEWLYSEPVKSLPFLMLLYCCSLEFHFLGGKIGGIILKSNL